MFDREVSSHAASRVAPDLDFYLAQLHGPQLESQAARLTGRQMLTGGNQRPSPLLGHRAFAGGTAVCRLFNRSATLKRHKPISIGRRSVGCVWWVEFHRLFKKCLPHHWFVIDSVERR